MKYFLLLLIILSTHIESVKPGGVYYDDVMEDLKTRNSAEVKLINLSNKPLFFSSDDKLIDEEKVKRFVAEVAKAEYGLLEVIDLSLNRLTEEVLPLFLPILQKDMFKYLDVSINSGAGSLPAMQLLADAIGDEPNKVNILKKIIWVPESYVFDEAGKPRELMGLPGVYADAHREYYKGKLFNSSFKLPE